MKQNKGFTLLELLIAVAISAFIIASTYEILNSIILSKSRLASHYIKSSVMYKLNSIFNKDFRESVKDSFLYNETMDKREFSFKTYNSIFFNNAILVTVKYYTEKDIDTDKEYLVREEINENMNFDLKIRLIPDVDDFKLKFYNGTEYSDNLPTNLYLYKVLFKWNKNNYEIICGRVE
jgi:prepilin-type N-terminal cleavage/methylation domain-containing protein